MKICKSKYGCKQMAAEMVQQIRRTASNIDRNFYYRISMQLCICMCVRAMFPFAFVRHHSIVPMFNYFKKYEFKHSHLELPSSSATWHKRHRERVLHEPY